MDRALLPLAERRHGTAARACGSRLLPVAAPVVVLLAAACASLVPKFDAPQVSIETVRVLRVVDSRAEIAVTLRLVNPNDSELAISGLEYEITLDGRAAANGRTTRVEPLAPGGQGTVDITGRVDIGAVATAMMALSSQLPVKYALNGKVTLQSGPSLPFSRKGEIAISKFDPATGPRPR
jgi:LEA14-like dessication related protein